MGVPLDFPRFCLGIFVGIRGEKRRKTLFYPFPQSLCRFSGQVMSFFGKIGTGDIVSYFHKKIKTLKKCKALENVQFAIFASQTGYPHDAQSLISRPVEKRPIAPPASYAFQAEIMPRLSTENGRLSTCKSGEGRNAAASPPIPSKQQ